MLFAGHLRRGGGPGAGGRSGRDARSGRRRRSPTRPMRWWCGPPSPRSRSATDWWRPPSRCSTTPSGSASASPWRSPRPPSSRSAWSGPSPVVLGAWQHLPADVRRRLDGVAREHRRRGAGVGRRASGGDPARGRRQRRACSTACWPGCRSAYPPRSVSPRSTRPSATRRPTSPGSTEPTARRRSGVVPTSSVRLGTVPPDDLPGLMRHLAETDALSTPRPSGRPGHDRGADAARRPTAAVRHVVYLPGHRRPDHDAVQPGRRRPRPGDRTSGSSPAHDTTYAAGIERGDDRGRDRARRPGAPRRSQPGRHGGGGDRSPTGRRSTSPTS